MKLTGMHAEMAAVAMDEADRIGIPQQSDDWMTFVGAFVTSVERELNTLAEFSPATFTERICVNCHLPNYSLITHGNRR